VVVEPNAFRRNVAEEFGAVTLDAGEDAVSWCLNDASDRGGFDVGFDCTGAAGALDVILKSVRRESTVVCVGVPRAPFALDITRFVIKQGITLTGSFGRSLWETWDVLGSLVSRGSLDLDALVTHRMGLEASGRLSTFRAATPGRS
jgi:threonine 3-dehydrogenase